MQRRIDQANNDGIAFASLGIDHRFKDTLEVATLEGKQLIESHLTVFFRLGKDHLLHNGQTLLLHEHVLGTAKTNTLRAKGDGTLRIARIVRIGPNTQAAELIGPAQQFFEVNFFIKVRVDRLDDACEDFAGCAIDRNVVTLFEYEAGRDDAEEMLMFAHANTLSSCDTGEAKTTRYHSSMTGRTTTCS